MGRKPIASVRDIGTGLMLGAVLVQPASAQVPAMDGFGWSAKPAPIPQPIAAPTTTTIPTTTAAPQEWVAQPVATPATVNTLSPPMLLSEPVATPVTTTPLAPEDNFDHLAVTSLEEDGECEAVAPADVDADIPACAGEQDIDEDDDQDTEEANLEPGDGDSGEEDESSYEEGTLEDGGDEDDGGGSGDLDSLCATELNATASMSGAALAPEDTLQVFCAAFFPGGQHRVTVGGKFHQTNHHLRFYVHNNYNYRVRYFFDCYYDYEVKTRYYCPKTSCYRYSYSTATQHFQWHGDVNGSKSYRFTVDAAKLYDKVPAAYRNSVKVDLTAKKLGANNAPGESVALTADSEEGKVNVTGSEE